MYEGREKELQRAIDNLREEGFNVEARVTNKHGAVLFEDPMKKARYDGH